MRQLSLVFVDVNVVIIKANNTKLLAMSSFIHPHVHNLHNHQASFQVHADVELFWYIMAEPQTYLRKGTMDMLLSGLIFLPPGVIG